MSKKILKTKGSSVPTGLGRQIKDDEALDSEMDKIFHGFDGARSIIPGSDVDPAVPDAGNRGYPSDEPLQDQGIRNVSSEGNFRHSMETEPGHTNQEFAHNNPIMTKIKSGHHGKHKKDPTADHVRKKGRKTSAQPQNLSGIPESEKLEGEDLDEYDEKPLDDDEEPRESKSPLPWKLSRDDAPIVYSEESSDTYGQDTNDDESLKAPASKKTGVMFHIGEDEEKEDPDYLKKMSKPKKTSKKEKHSEVEFEMRRRQGSELFSAGSENKYFEDDEENLKEGDLEDIAGHRFEKSKGLSKHKITHGHHKGRVRVEHEDAKDMGYGFRTELDHSPHELFIEMDELEGEEWVERSRWIKYEEDLEAEVGRWGKPHVASLTFHSLINLRLCMESGSLLLDMSAKDLPELVHRVVEDLSEKGIIEEDQKAKVLRVLLYRHKHVEPHQNTFKFGLKRTMSQRSFQGLLPSTSKGAENQDESTKQDANFNTMENGFLANKDEDHLVLDMNGAHGGLKRNSTQGSFKRTDSFDNIIKARKRDILACMEDGTEGAVVLVGSLDDLEKPIVAFVRLAEAIGMPNTIEINLPVRFIFILLTPSQNMNMDPHEIGRSFSTLMSNPAFHNVAYRVEEKQELLHAINEFLDDSVVLPPGDWDRKHILPINEIMEMRQRRKTRKEGNTAEEEKKGAKVDTGGGGDDDPPKRNPLQRTSTPFGGIIEDIKNRYPLFLSDLKDGLNSQVLAATIFIYFAALSGAIAFGGIMGTKTMNEIGVSETLIMTCVCGVLFALLSGCPLIIIGTTGPVLLYDEALYQFCANTLPKQFLHWRVWIGIWTFIISLVVAGVQGSTLVRYFTKFTKDIFAGLVSLLFIYEALRKLSVIFSKHPLMDIEHYCGKEIDCIYKSQAEKWMKNDNWTDTEHVLCNETGAQPNTALLSMILMFGTFFIAYFLRIFRNSQYLGRNIRRALGDFGVPIAIVLMVLIDYSAGDTYTEKLNVPEGLQVTNSTYRGWFISPLGIPEGHVDVPEGEALAVWAMFAAVLPALLLYLLLFMETHICELIMMEKTKEEKGAGLHLDIVLLSLMNMVCAFFGGPWICAATVRSVSHVSALTVFSTTNVPGESPKVIGVRDQRLSATLVSILIGVSVLLAPILKLVPFAVLFGVFLYMGVSGMNGVQFFDRLTLMLMPVKHHPNVSYVKVVKTWRLHLFTVLQGLGLVILWIVKSTAAALAFPFFVVAMIPYRLLLKFIFTERELDALDGAQAGKNYEDFEEEHDFFEQANEVPITPATQMPLHRSLMGMMKIPLRDSKQKS